MQENSILAETTGETANAAEVVGRTGEIRLTVKKLKSGKKYYVRIRTYKTVNNTSYYSEWSKAKTVTIKK